MPPGCLREAFEEVEVVHAEPLVEEVEADDLVHAGIQTTTLIELYT